MKAPEHIQGSIYKHHREIDYLKVMRIFLSRWYVFAGTTLLAILLAQLYLWYSPKTYATSGTLKFEEKKPELSDLVKVMSNATRSPASLQSEKSIIHSRRILLNAIKRLDYKISFFKPNNFRNQELYPQRPLHISVLKIGKQLNPENLITFQPINQKTFLLSWNIAGSKIQQSFTYDSPIKIFSTSFVIHYTTALSQDSSYLFKFNAPEQLLTRVKKGLQTTETIKASNVIHLHQKDSNPYFAAAVLNAIMESYLSYDKDQKTQSATQMINFINRQLGFLSSEVKNAENELEKYKQSSGIMDIRASANQALSRINELESQSSLLKIQEIAINQLKKQLTEDKTEIALNLNLEGPIDPLLGPLIHNLNSLLQDKQVLLKSYAPTAAPVQDINLQIVKIKDAALQNIKATHQRLLKNISLLNSRLNQLHQKATKLPAAEKNLISLVRNFEINEKVYSFLSEKKLETQINRSAVLPGATIIEYAEIKEIPVTPNPVKVYRNAIVMGLFTGIITLILLRVLNPYVYDKEIVHSTITTPIAGIIRKFPGKTDEYNSKVLDLIKPGTVFAESLRAVRSYLNFLATEKKSKVISITSEMAGEGKSFVALNLASSLAMLDKKVIIIGADLRKPKLHEAFGIPNNQGLSTYLYEQNTIDEVIQQTEYKNLDVIIAGPTPHDPSELLQRKKMTELITELRNRYDFIMIDNAPVGMVSDAISLLCESDISLFVIRYGKSKSKSLSTAQGLTHKYDIKNMVIVLNAFEENRLQSSYYKDDVNLAVQHYCADYNSYKNSDYYKPS